MIGFRRAKPPAIDEALLQRARDAARVRATLPRDPAEWGRSYGLTAGQSACVIRDEARDRVKRLSSATGAKNDG